MATYFEKNKQQIFPKIKDWSNPQNKIRHSNNVKDMTWSEWFYLHPSAYKLCYYGFDSQGALICTSLAVYFGIIRHSFIGVILGALGILFLLSLIKKLKNRKQIEDFTFYDLYMREYNG